MSAAESTFTLNTGAKIPVVALGTFKCSDEETYNSVSSALKVGYRHIDTAKLYGNEDAVGKAIRDSGIPREEIFVTTKLWLNDFHDPVGALETSLKKLGLDYVDLYLMHWPVPVKTDSEGNNTLDTSLTFIQAYEKMQEIPKSKARALGVSNFDVKNLQALLDAPTTKTPPATNQCELHVKLPQQKLVDFCHSKNIVPEAWGPLGQGDLKYDILDKIAKKHDCSVANVVLSWNIQRKVVVLPKSTHEERLKANLTYVELDKQDLGDILSISEKNGINRHSTAKSDLGVDVDIFHNNADSEL